MRNELLRLILLQCFSAFRGERSTAATYHLLTGKKSSQTIQDASLYKISKYFGVFPSLSRPIFDEYIQSLEKKQFIVETEDNTFILTNMGNHVLQSHKSEFVQIEHINGLDYSKYELPFWKKITLLIQVISYANHKVKQYIPLYDEVEILQWVKGFVQLYPSRSKLAKDLHRELQSCLYKVSNTQATIFTYRLTGHHRVGLTFTQLASEFKYDLTTVELVFKNVLHSIIQTVITNKDEHPILSSLVEKDNEQAPLTKSAQVTFDLLTKGLDYHDIARVRNLKIPTIEDHIVEIAQHVNGFCIDPYISKDRQNYIRETLAHCKTRKLRIIKQALDIEATYFEIRLVLAKSGENIESRKNTAISLRS
ncbi:hypothetical protein EJF36_11630 [Bacillus sp. HMF5848]|uniref:helix-turn-helix domain-containing protein n=1 Tax=Bacillus sp. HMF5848 TaxID=2495421 RepID=UPI000F77F7CF|nr:helix-turn-helix domain-containing protein [Bacillus sp. HMF5848]RSK27480.1 hypothetical protein EJF36_11630 [Bacillus sp. HMF5848]